MVDKYRAKARRARKVEAREKGCDRKARFESREAALALIPSAQEPYACGLCGGFHRRTIPELKLRGSMRVAARGRR